MHMAYPTTPAVAICGAISFLSKHAQTTEHMRKSMQTSMNKSNINSWFVAGRDLVDSFADLAFILRLQGREATGEASWRISKGVWRCFTGMMESFVKTALLGGRVVLPMVSEEVQLMVPGSGLPIPSEGLLLLASIGSRLMISEVVLLATSEGLLLMTWGRRS